MVKLFLKWFCFSIVFNALQIDNFGYFYLMEMKNYFVDPSFVDPFFCWNPCIDPGKDNLHCKKPAFATGDWLRTHLTWLELKWGWIWIFLEKAMGRNYSDYLTSNVKNALLKNVPEIFKSSTRAYCLLGVNYNTRAYCLLGVNYNSWI